MPDDIRALTEWLETSGYAVYYADVDLGPKGRWQRVLAGAYTDPQVAQREADRLNVVVPGAKRGSSTPPPRAASEN